MTEGSSYTPRPAQQVVAWRSPRGWYAFGPFTDMVAAAAYYGRLVDEEIGDADAKQHGRRCRIVAPFYLTGEVEQGELDLEPDRDAPPAELTEIFVRDNIGFVVEVLTGIEPVGNVIGIFPTEGIAIEWWDQHRRFFKPTIRAVVMPLINP